MEEENAHHTIAIDSAHRVGLSFGHDDESPDEQEIDDEHTCRTDKAFFFAHGAEDEVGVLLWHIAEFRLGAVEESFAEQTARTNGDFGLIDIVACPSGVILHAEQHLDADALVVVQTLEERVGEIEEGRGGDGKEGDESVADEPCVDGQPDDVANHEDAEAEHDVAYIEGNDEDGEEQG